LSAAHAKPKRMQCGGWGKPKHHMFATTQY
jgi:hypothetical protein